MPPGIVIPELPYTDVERAAEWLCRVFGFTERLRIGTHRAQLVLGGGSVIAIAAPRFTEPAPASLMVRIADVDAHHAHASQAGAKVVRAPQDCPYGERQYTVEDLGGHSWTFSQSIADVDPKDWGGQWLEKEAAHPAPEAARARDVAEGAEEM